jgi:3-oxoacyl-[acyl-carrier-protein] synthase-3
LKILGTGSYLPPKVVTNDDLARSLDTSDEWIHSHTGIHSRHIAEADDCTSTMAVKAAKLALEGVNTVGASTYFVNPTVGNSAWFNQRLTCTIVIADHAFYA